MYIKLSILLVIFILFLGCSSKQPDFEKALQKYNRGNFQQAFNSFSPLAKEGDPKAQFYLGNMFFFGKGTNQDYKKAVVFYKLAADANCPAAQNNLSVCYFSGLGVEKDFKKGLTYLQIASLEGQPIALLRLGARYYNGDGVEQNYKLAFHCFDLAKRKGNLAQAFYMLGRMYLNGEGVGENREMALVLMRIAARKGELAAQFHMGFYYLINDDIDLAKKWFIKANKRGNIPDSDQNIQDILKFAKILKQDREKAKSYFDNKIGPFNKLRPLPILESPKSNPYSKPYRCRGTSSSKQ